MSNNVGSKKDIPSVEVILWWIIRSVLAVGIFTATTTPKKLMVLVALLSTFIVGAAKKLFAKSEFFSDLSYRLQTCICLVALFGSGIGFGFGVFQLFPEYDVPLSLFGGIIGTAMGYYISIAFRKPFTRKGFNYTAFMSFCISNALIIVKEVTQFWIDFYTGRTLVGCVNVSDDHWFIRLVGPMLSLPEHRPLYDFSEDVTLTVVGSFIATAVLYINLISKNREVFAINKNAGNQLKELFSNFSARCKDKINFEIAKVREQTNIADMLLWWCTRIVMVYAFITFESRAEATLLLVVSLGTVAITALHLVTPKDSMFCKINYRVQSLLCVIVFLGSYCGNYVGVYAYAARFDTFLHFTSGFLGFFAGYYIAQTLVKPNNRKEQLSLCLFALAFAMTIIPIHEMTEFIGDYIWGTTNQGFMWEPEPDKMIYVIFGRGKDDPLLVKIFDTMYDMILASSSSIISFVIMMISYIRKDKKTKIVNKTVTEKQAVTC
jgi:hypothetical protein